MHSDQRGAALMLMLVIMVVGSLSLLVSSLGQARLQTARDSKTSRALAEAKEALLAYAVSNSTRPGNLPCPDRDAPGTTGYGDAEGSCASVSGTSVGRLPWKTLGIAELVDADGEPLWYMLSDNFRASAAIINSDTPGSLSIYDNSGATLLTPAGSEAVAIVFAPGAPLGAQSRSSALSALCATTGTTILQNKCAANYLDTGANGRNNSAPGGPFIAANKTDTFNDRLLYITTEDMFASIEKLVSKKIESGIKPMLNSYYSVWGAFPLAAHFVRPSTSTFTGQAATLNGLLPIGNIVNSSSSPLWKAGSTPTYAVSGGASGNCSVDASNIVMDCPCTSHGCPASISIPAGKTLTISADVAGVGFGLWNMFDKEDLNQVAFEAQGSPGKKLYSNAALNLTNVNLAGQLHADGSATVTLTVTAKAGGSTLKFVEMKGMLSSSTAPLALWLLPNNWHQLMYYALSQGYAPGSYPPGGNTCVLRTLSAPANPPYYCLGVNGVGGGNNKQAVVVMMGRALAGKTHTTGSLADYLEGENATPADFMYENKTRTSTFNDQVIFVAP